MPVLYFEFNMMRAAIGDIKFREEKYNKVVHFLPK